MAKFLVHIGYFNSIEDIEMFTPENNADDVMNAINSYKGAFHTVSDDSEKTFSDFEGNGSLTKDGKYFVSFPTQEDFDYYATQPDSEDLFIDIYEVKGGDNDYNAGFCDEFCPECDTEVELPRNLGVYRCPHCGKWVVNCSMCYLLDEGKCSHPNCPLSFEAKRRNKLEKEHLENE